MAGFNVRVHGDDEVKAKIERAAGLLGDMRLFAPLLDWLAGDDDLAQSIGAMLARFGSHQSR
jgi:hypothetical protein